MKEGWSHFENSRAVLGYYRLQGLLSISWRRKFLEVRLMEEVRGRGAERCGLKFGSGGAKLVGWVEVLLLVSRCELDYRNPVTGITRM